MAMLLRFLWLVIRPISKLQSAIGAWDVVNLVILIAYPTIGGIIPLEKLFEGANLAWFAGIPIILLLIAGIKLQFKLASFEKRMPQLQASLLSFPISGYRIVKSSKLFSPQVGHAKIIVRNTGDLLEDCIGTVTGIAKVNVVKGELKVTPLIFTHSNLFWENGEVSANIPNDGVDRYLNLAYLDQNKPDAWQLAVEEQKREDYFTGWHKIDVVISSLKMKVESLKVEVALGFGGRKTPPPPLNLWPWDAWYKSILEQMQQEPRKEDFQLE